MLARDHYATLGIPPDADQEEIESAFQHLSRRYHPDINPADRRAAAVYEKIEEAYQVLSDPERRARYDRETSPQEVVEEELLELELEVVASEGQGGTYAQLFRRLVEHERRTRPNRGDDVDVSVSVPLEQVERGKRVTVEYRRLVPCDPCGGGGRVQLDRHRPCRRCDGTGKEVFTKASLAITATCCECGGDGLRTGVDCDGCRGTGLRRRTETTVIRVPPGIHDGHVIRIPERGHHGIRGGTPGDLVVRCRVEGHPEFERQGPHLRRTVPITVPEAILGGRVRIDTIDGETAGLRLPPGTANGQVFRLPQRGLQLPDGRRGDLYVEVEVWIPELVDEDSKELIREFAARNPHDPRSDPSEATTRR